MLKSPHAFTFSYILGILVGYGLERGGAGSRLKVVVVLLCILVYLGLKQLADRHIKPAQERWKPVAILCLLFFLLGAVRTYTAPEQIRAPFRPFYGREVVVIGRMIDTSRYRPILLAEQVESGGHLYGINGRVEIVFSGECRSDFSCAPGDLVRISGQLTRPAGRSNPRDFSREEYLLPQRVGAVIRVVCGELDLLATGDRWSLQRLSAGLRSDLETLFEHLLGPRESAFISAVLFGDRGNLPADIEERFAATGALHLTAVSGLHVGFVALLFVRGGEIIGLSSGLSFLFSGMAVAAYALLCGLRTSVLRASLMLFFLQVGQTTGIRVSPVRSLSVTALLLLISNPLLIFTVSFQLSFAAVVGLLWFTPGLKALFGRVFPGPVADGLAVSLSAQLGTAPLLAYYFNRLSPVAPMANLVLVPLGGIAVCLAFAVGLIGLIFVPLAELLAIPLDLSIRLLNLAAAYLASIPKASAYVPAPGLHSLVLYYLLVVLIPFPLPVKWYRMKRVAVIILTLILAATFYPPSPRLLEITIVDVGFGDGILIRTPEGYQIAVDGGVGDRFFNFLLRNGIYNLDLVVISHLHSDHAAGLIPVIEHLRIGTVIGPFPPGEIGKDPHWKAEFGAVLADHGRYRAADCSQQFKLGATSLDILHPPPGGYDPGQKNDSSVVIRLEYGDFRLLLTGDIEEQGQRSLLERHRIRLLSDVLKVPHHGSYEVSLPEFIDAVDPRIAVISTASGYYGHPHPETIRTLQEAGVIVYRTDREGAVTIRTDGSRYRVLPFLNDRVGEFSAGRQVSYYLPRLWLDREQGGGISISTGDI